MNYITNLINMLTIIVLLHNIMVLTFITLHLSNLVGNKVMAILKIINFAIIVFAGLVIIYAIGFWVGYSYWLK